jgi:rubredoxin-NAD+ reductase
VIAAGARPFRPPALAGAALFTVNHIDDWERLSAMIANSVQTRAVVIGGGLIGCELAENLVSKCQSVTVIEKQDLPLGSLIPEKAGQRLLEHLNDIDVNFLGSSTVTHVVEGDGCSTVCLEAGTTLEADLIILATGLVTDQRIAKSADLKFDNGLIVDSKTLETSQKGIYALGDCIAFEGRPSRYVEPIIKQAKAIAHAIVGKAAPYEHREPVVRVKTPKLPITIEGLVQPKAAWITKVDTEALLVMEQVDGSRKSTVSIGR